MNIYEFLTSENGMVTKYICQGTDLVGAIHNGGVNQFSIVSARLIDTDHVIDTTP